MRSPFKPIALVWDATEEVFRPLHAAKKLCHEQYVDGEVYLHEAINFRDMNSHRHYMASIKEAWKNWPENEEPMPTPTHLRKRAMIACNFCDTQTYILVGADEARKLAALIKHYDEHALVEVVGKVVKCHTAWSQSVQAIDKKEFQKQKWDVLDWCAAKIGTTRAALEAQNP